MDLPQFRRAVAAFGLEKGLEERFIAIAESLPENVRDALFADMQAAAARGDSALVEANAALLQMDVIVNGAEKKVHKEERSIEEKSASDGEAKAAEDSLDNA